MNKAEIKAKAPSEYMEDFSKENEAIDKTMATHLIGDFEEFGINNDDFEKVIQQRAKLISKEIKKRLIEKPQKPQKDKEVDREMDKKVDYYEEDESEEGVE